MKLGISSYTYGWAVSAGLLDAQQLIDRASAFGVRVLQLCDNLPPETWSPDRIEQTVAAARDRGITLELGARGCRPADLRRDIAIARAINSRIMRLVLDTADDEPAISEAIARLKSVQSELTDAGVTLAIENHDRFPAAVLLRIVEVLDAPCYGICLDTVNSFGAMEGPAVVVKTLRARVVNLHLKDFAVVRHSYLQGFSVEGRPLGDGTLDVPWLLDQLAGRADNLSGIVELWTPPESTTEKTVEKEARWAEQSVRTARQWITN